MNLGERIQSLLDEKGISQRELAASLHMHPNTLNGYIRNRRCPDCETVAKIASFLGTTSDYLLGNTQTCVPPTPRFSSGEGLLLSNYRSLDESGKHLLEEISIVLCSNMHRS